MKDVSKNASCICEKGQCYLGQRMYIKKNSIFSWSILSRPLPKVSIQSIFVE